MFDSPQLCAVEYSRRDDVAGLMREMREKEEVHSLETAAFNNSLASANATLVALQTQVRLHRLLLHCE